MGKKTRNRKEKNIVHLDGDTKKYVSRYLADMKKDTKCCRDWIKNRDFEKIGEFAHMLKGSGGAMGFGKISEFGRTLERETQKTNWKAIKKCVEQIFSYLTHLEVSYDKRPYPLLIPKSLRKGTAHDSL